jgi:hypothetical protein
MILAYVIWVIGLCWLAYAYGIPSAVGVVLGWLLGLLAIKVFFKKPTQNSN